MRLRELFDQPVPFTVDIATNYGYEASFTIGEDDYTFHAYMEDDEYVREFPDDEREADLPVDAVVGKPPCMQELNDLVLRIAPPAAF